MTGCRLGSSVCQSFWTNFLWTIPCILQRYGQPFHICLFWMPIISFQEPCFDVSFGHTFNDSSVALCIHLSENSVCSVTLGLLYAFRKCQLRYLQLSGWRIIRDCLTLSYKLCPQSKHRCETLSELTSQPERPACVVFWMLVCWSFLHRFLTSLTSKTAWSISVTSETMLVGHKLNQLQTNKNQTESIQSCSFQQDFKYYNLIKVLKY